MKTKQQAEVEARNIVDSWTMGALLTAWIPGSAIFLTGGDLVMVRQVADAFGVGTFDPDAVAAVIGGALAGGVVSAVISEGVGWIPVAGWAVKSVMMAAKAKSIGDVVIAYFRDLSPLTE